HHRRLRAAETVRARAAPRPAAASPRRGAVRVSETGFTRVAGELFGSWRLVEPVGRGGFSEVWRARRDDAAAADVAIKVILHPEHVAQLRAEANALAIVRGEGVVQVLAVDLAHDPPFMALGYLAGGSLRGRLRTLGKVDAIA